LRPIPLPSIEISLENIENVMEQDAARCTCITCMKPTYGTFSAGISKITYVKCKGCWISIFETHIGLGNRNKRFAV